MTSLLFRNVVIFASNLTSYQYALWPHAQLKENIDITKNMIGVFMFIVLS